ncbi:hypothetical protein [Oceanithermus sp.]
MGWVSLKILTPASVLAGLVFVVFFCSGLAAPYAVAFSALTGLVAWLLLSWLPGTAREIVFATSMILALSYLAKPFIDRAKDPYTRNIRWLLALVAVLSFSLAIAAWLL